MGSQAGDDGSLRVERVDAIDLSIPQTTSAQFSATLATGSITLTNLILSNDTVTPGSRSGTLGSGDGTIDLDVVNGTIVVRGF